jgi:hypothetical protein
MIILTQVNWVHIRASGGYFQLTTTLLDKSGGWKNATTVLSEHGWKLDMLHCTPIKQE